MTDIKKQRTKRRINIIYIVISSLLLLIIAGTATVCSMISSFMAKTINNHMQTIDLSKLIPGFDRTIVYGKAETLYFPGIGVKVYDVVEHGSNKQIVYSDPVSIGYNLLSQNIELSYDGVSSLEDRMGSAIEIQGSTIFLIHLPLSKILKSIIGGNSNFYGLLNSDRIEYRSNINAVSHLGKEIISEPIKSSAKLTLVKNECTSLESFIADLPTQCSLDISYSTFGADKHMSNTSSGSDHFILMPVSSNSTKSVLEFSLKLAHNIVTDALPSGDIKLSMNIANLESQDAISVAYNTKIDNKDDQNANSTNFNIEVNSKNMYEYGRDVFSALSSVFDKEPVYRKCISMVEQMNKDNLFAKTIGCELSFDSLDTSKERSMNFKNLSFYWDDISVRGDSTIKYIQSSDTHLVKGNIYMFKYERMSDIVGILVGEYLSLPNVFVSQYIKDVLRAISNYPESTSPDLVFDYSFSTNKLLDTKRYLDFKDFYISSLNKSQLQTKLSQIFLRSIIKYSVSQKDKDTSFDKIFGSRSIRPLEETIKPMLKEMMKNLNP